MKKSVFKDFIREIKGSLGRFFAIMAIVAIGVAFFAGITASSNDMKHSSDSYYDEYNMNDIMKNYSLMSEENAECFVPISALKFIKDNKLDEKLNINYKRHTI